MDTFLLFLCIVLLACIVYYVIKIYRYLDDLKAADETEMLVPRGNSDLGMVQSDEPVIASGMPVDVEKVTAEVLRQMDKEKAIETLKPPRHEISNDDLEKIVQMVARSQGVS